MHNSMCTMDKIHNGLLRKFHALCSRLGLTEAEKRAIIESFGVESSADIDTHDLIDICASLSKQLEGDKGDEMDKLRTRHFYRKLSDAALAFDCFSFTGTSDHDVWCGNDSGYDWRVLP